VKIDSNDAAVCSRYVQVESLAHQIAIKCQEEIERLGFKSKDVEFRSPESAQYYLEKDPLSGEFALMGNWTDDRGSRLGSLVFHPDGSFYVEQDVVRPHPAKKKWFVEAISAWGKGSMIRAEAKLLDVPD
jgi:hypothetical protein